MAKLKNEKIIAIPAFINNFVKVYGIHFTNTSGIRNYN
jgi:hypothetical protein